MVSPWKLPYIFHLLPTQDQPEKAKHASQISTQDALLLVSLFAVFPCQQPPIRAYTQSLSFFHSKTFSLLCLPLGVCLSLSNSDWLSFSKFRIAFACSYLFGFHFFHTVILRVTKLIRGRARTQTLVSQSAESQVLNLYSIYSSHTFRMFLNNTF